MTQATPLVECERLVYQQEGQEQTLVVETSAWYAWLRTATTFVFTCDCGAFTARRERAGNKRGGWYWRAYRQRDGKLRRVYIGKSEELTLQRLNTVAATLAQRDDATMNEREPVQPIVQGQPGSTGDRGRFLQPSTGVSWDPTEPGAASESAARRSSTLPVPLTPLIGREREVAAAWTLLQRAEVRLLTLTGTGGVGKTRLALEIASALQEDFSDGVWFVSLAPIHDAALVLPTLVQALRLQASGTRLPLLEHLKAALRDKHLLLLLDNFEQVVAAAPLLVDLLVACARLKLLVTSRAGLLVRGERIFTVQPLALSDPKHLLDCETLSRYGAVALFLERAREVQPGFQLTRDNARLIAEICQRLDGLLLAIELAAARLKLLPLQTLLERLEHRLHLLTGGPRDLPVRQQPCVTPFIRTSQQEMRVVLCMAEALLPCIIEEAFALIAGTMHHYHVRWTRKEQPICRRCTRPLMQTEEIGGGEHDTAYRFTLPSSMSQTLAWARLLARLHRGELVP